MLLKKNSKVEGAELEENIANPIKSKDSKSGRRSPKVAGGFLSPPESQSECSSNYQVINRKNRGISKHSQSSRSNAPAYDPLNPMSTGSR